MAINVEVSIHIDRSPEDVFAAISDVLSSPEWIESVKEVRDYSGDPIGLGSTYQQVTKFLGKEFTIDIEVITFEPPMRYGESFSGTMPGEMMISLDEMDGGTHLQIQAEVEPGGFFGLAAPLIKSNFQKQLSGDMNRLKQILESE
jgi:uncharacterized membrane protein